MSTINEWSDDLIGQVVKYKGQDAILIAEWVSGTFALAWWAKYPDVLSALPLEECEATHRRADEKLCSLAMKAWAISGRVEQIKFNICQELCASADDDSSERVVEALQSVARSTKGLAEEAKELEQLTEHSEPDPSHYEYAVQIRRSGEQYVYIYGWQMPGLEIKPMISTSPNADCWGTLEVAEKAARTAREVFEGDTDVRIVRRKVGESEVIE